MTDLITESRARIRRRSAFAAVLAALVVLTTLVVSLRVTRPHTVADAAPEKPGVTLRTDVPKPATQEEMAGRKKRLQSMLTSSLDRILPKGWQRSTFDFDCDQTHCWAGGEIKDDRGRVEMSASAWMDIWAPPCYQPTCTKKVLDDGTLVNVTRSDNSGDVPKAGASPTVRVSVVGIRPDNTTTEVSAQWPEDRSTPPLPDDQWLRFATAFRY